MQPLASDSKIVRFGVFQLNLRSGELYKAGLRVKLQQQPLQILTLLLEHPNDIVTREELRAKLWPTDTFVDFEHSLNTAVRKLRDALGDGAENPIFIETIPRRGYRFIAPLEACASAAPGEPPTPASTPPPETPSVTTPGIVVGTGMRIRGLVLGIVMVIGLVGMLGWKIMHDRRITAESAPKIRSLAVLPLANLSGDPNQEYFADGLTEELTTELGKISALRVISRTSVLKYKGTKKSVREIARELNVDALLEGTVLRSGNHVRITANLVQASPESHLWAETYDTLTGDALSVQRQVADAVAHEIRVAVAPRDSASSRGNPSVNPEAQDLYFRGLHALRSAGGGATQSAINYFQQAIRKDPNFARAYSGLAMAYAVWYPDDPGPREAMPKARDAALRAVALDDSLPGAHMALGYVELSYDWNWAEAQKDFRRALELDPNFAVAHSRYARELVALGRTDEALSHVARALELEPYSGLDYPAWVLYLAHRYDDSLELAQKMVAMDPNFSWGRWALAANYEQLGKQKEATQEYIRFETLSGSNPKRIKSLQEGLTRSGVRGFWQASLDDYRRTTKSNYAPPVLVAGVCLRLGDKPCALAWLEKGFQERDDLMIDLKVDPTFDGLRSDPRFQDLLRRVGL